MRENKIVCIVTSILSLVCFGLIFIQDTLMQTIFLSLFASMVISSIVSLTNFFILRKNELQSIINEMHSLRSIDFDSVRSYYFELLGKNTDDNSEKFVNSLIEFCNISSNVVDKLSFIRRNYINKNYRNIITIVYDELAIKTCFYKVIIGFYKTIPNKAVISIQQIKREMTFFDKYILNSNYYKILRQIVRYSPSKKSSMEVPADIEKINNFNFEIMREFTRSNTNMLKILENQEISKTSKYVYYNTAERYKITEKFIKKYDIKPEWITND